MEKKFERYNRNEVSATELAEKAGRRKPKRLDGGLRRV